MDYHVGGGRIGGAPSYSQGGPAVQGNSQTVGLQGNFGTQFGGSATGPALVLIGLVAFLVLDYVWTRGQQGGR